MFQSDLQRYNELFDQERKIDYKFAKEYDKEAKVIFDETEKIKDEADKQCNKFDRYSRNTGEIKSLLRNKKLRFFESLDAYTKKLSDDANETLKTIDNNSNLLGETDYSKELKNSCSNYINTLDKLKDFKFLKKLGTIFGISCLIALIFLVLAFNPYEAWLRIIFGVLSALSLIPGVLVFVYCYIRNKHTRSLLSKNQCSAELIDKYVKETKNQLNTEKNKVDREFMEIYDKNGEKLKKIGDKYQDKIDLEARDIKAEMRSFTAIDKAITNLVDCYKDEIKWSSDYMKVFEKNFYMNFENEDQFMRACRDLVEKKERKRKEEKERQRAEFERWEQQEEMKRHNREMEEQQRKQMDSLNKQHEEQRKAAGQLCASCKNYIGCPLRINLTTPVCSKYKSKY